MAGGRQLLANALQNFVFSLSQGMAASAQAPGARGTRMGMAAALGAPMQLQEMLRQREAQDQERQMKIQEFQNQLRQGKINEALAMLKVQQGRPAPQTPVSFEAQGQTPVSAMPGQTQAAMPAMQASIRGQLPAIPSPMGPLQPQSAEELADVQAMDPEFKIRQQNQLLAQQREARLGSQAQATIDATLTKAGYRAVRDAEGNVTDTVPLKPSELSEIEQRKLKDAENLGAFRQASTELANARAELARVQADPNNPQYALRRRALDIAEQNMMAAVGRLGISQENLDVRKATLEATGGISPERQKMQENAKSGLRAIDKLRSELKKPGTLVALSVPGSPAARVARAARNEMIDVLTRLRTGAALNREEQAFYRDQAPNLIDALFSDPDTIEYKLSIFENEFKGLSGPNKVSLSDRSTKPSTPNSGNRREQFSPSTGQYRHTLDGGKTWVNGRLPK